MKFKKIYYYSFVISFVVMMTMTLIRMFFVENGMVVIQEPNIIIRIVEIFVGASLVMMSLFFISDDILRINKRVEINLDKKTNTFLVTDPNTSYWSSVPIGDIVVDLDKDGRLCGFEILNANAIRINMEKYEKIIKRFETEKGKKGVKK